LRQVGFDHAVAGVDDIATHFADALNHGGGVVERQLGDKFEAHHFPDVGALVKLARE
jgi:hypothetical protein